MDAFGVPQEEFIQHRANEVGLVLAFQRCRSRSRKGNRGIVPGRHPTSFAIFGKVRFPGLAILADP